MKDLTYEERLKEMQVTVLEERRKRGDLITVYTVINELEETDRNYLIQKSEGITRNLRGQLKLRKGRCLNRTKKYNFPHRNEDVCNGLNEEVTEARNAQQLKEKLDKYRYGNRTT